MSEQDIIEGCKLGNRLSQHKLYETYYSKLLPICIRYAVDVPQAKDWMQDVFMRIYDKIGLNTGSGSFEGWMKRVTVNFCLDKVRKDQKLFFSDDMVNILDAEHEYSFEIDGPRYMGLTSKDIFESLSHLSPKYKIIFNMFALDGYTHKDISEELGITEGTSKSNLFKAKQNLKKILEKKLDNQ